MPAPDLPTLYDFEDTLVAAFQTYLTTEDIGATPQIARSIDVQSAPAVLLRVEHGGAAQGFENAQKLFTTDGNFSKDRFFEGRLIATIRTNRQADAADDDHRLIRKKLRASLYDCLKSTAGINAQLSYHSIRGIYEESTEYPISEDEGFDDTDINWSLIYCIQDSAWP